MMGSTHHVGRASYPKDPSPQIRFKNNKETLKIKWFFLKCDEEHKEHKK
jgi:hypothetical protein